jgi:hypothetical protein
MCRARKCRGTWRPHPGRRLTARTDTENDSDVVGVADLSIQGQQPAARWVLAVPGTRPTAAPQDLPKEISTEQVNVTKSYSSPPTCP